MDLVREVPTFDIEWVYSPRLKKDTLCFRARFRGISICNLVLFKRRESVGQKTILSIRHTKERGPIIIAETQLFSGFSLPSAGIAFRAIPANHVLLCPGYDLGDMQMCVTGSIKRYKRSPESDEWTYEDPIDAAIRELHEELGLIVDHDDIKLLCVGERVKDRRHTECTATHFSLDMDKCQSAEITVRPPRSNGKDFSKQKVSVIVHASLPVMRDLITRVGPTDPKETITHLAIVPVAIALIVSSHVENHIKITDDGCG